MASKDRMLIDEMPLIDVRMLNIMQRIFPDKLPIGRLSPEDLTYLQGQQSIIRWLKEISDKQTQ